MGLTQVLALYAAIASTVAIALHIIRIMNDRGQIDISADVRSLRGTERLRLAITVTNRGKHPIFVRALGVEIRDESYTLPPTNVSNNMLHEGEHFSQNIDGLPNLDITEIYVLDSNNRKWRISRRNLKRLFRNIERMKH